MATRIQVETKTGYPDYLVLHFAETPQDVQRPESKPGNKLGGKPPVVSIPKPLPPSREAHVKTKLELKIIQAKEQKIQSLLQKVRAAATAGGWEAEAEAWMKEFNAYPPDSTEERAISLSTFVLEVLTPLRHYALHALACEILQMLLPEGEPVESYLQACQIGLAKRDEFLRRCERENAVAEAHFEACRSFEKKDDTQIAQEVGSLQEKMWALQKMRGKINREAKGEVLALIQKINALEEQLRAQAAAARTQDLAGSSLSALIAEWRTFLERLK